MITVTKLYLNLQATEHGVILSIGQTKATQAGDERRPHGSTVLSTELIRYCVLKDRSRIVLYNTNRTSKIKLICWKKCELFPRSHTKHKQTKPKVEMTVVMRCQCLAVLTIISLNECPRKI